MKKSKVYENIENKVDMSFKKFGINYQFIFLVDKGEYPCDVLVISKNLKGIVRERKFHWKDEFSIFVESIFKKEVKGD